jgi:hypothetical protein
MAAAPPPLIVALQAAGFAMQVDLAPLATQVQLAAAVAPLATQVQLAAAVAPLATQAQMQAQFAAMQAQLAAIQAQLALIGVPAIAGAASAIVRATAVACARNAHCQRDLPYAAVPRDDGTPPPSWPAGFSRAELVEGNIGVIDAILGDYGLPNGAPAGSLFQRREALARHIGTWGV